MKTLFYILLSLSLFNLRPTKPKPNANVSTCYGYNPCTACSNCSACKHCGAGGSCGVCSSSTAKTVRTLSSSPKSSSKTSTYVGQCKALTKRGSRCKRSGNGSGYCWQHGK